MKKIILLTVAVLGCGFPALAQGSAGKALGKLGYLSQEEIARSIIAQQMRHIGRQTLLNAELTQYKLIPLTINGATSSWETVVAFPLESANSKTEMVGTLRPYTYGDAAGYVADRWLREYLMSLGEEEDIHFVYRGMHVADLDDVKNVLLNGLRVDKTYENGIYVTTAPIVARHYARTQVPGEIPVFVTMEQDDVVDYLQPKRHEYFSETDIPAEAISHVFAFLDINGHPAWYRVVLDDEMVFIPLPNTTQEAEDVLNTTSQMVPQPVIKILSLSEIRDIRLQTRLETGFDFPFPFETDWTVLSRGMHLNNFEDLQNILVNGLQKDASGRHLIYAARRPATAVTFAVAPITEGEFPVLIRIPVTEELLRVNPPNEQIGYYQSTFNKDIPSRMFDVFAFLEIDGKIGWYQVRLRGKNQLDFTFVESRSLLPIIEEDM